MHSFTLFTALFIIFSFQTPKSFADDLATNAPKKSAKVLPNEKRVHRSYTESKEGIDSILKDLKRTQPKIYSELKDEGESLMSKITTAQVAYWGGTISGIAVVTYGVITSMHSDSESSYESTKKSGMTFMTGLGIGAGLYFGGLIVAAIICPSHQDFLNFINHHNEVNPTDQFDSEKNTNVNINVGMTNDLKGGTVGVAFNF